MEEYLNQYWDYFSLNFYDSAKLHTHTHVLPIGAIVIYYITISVLPSIVVKIKPEGFHKELKPFVALWNLFLSILSLIMLLNVFVPFYLHGRNVGFLELLCDQNAKVMDMSSPLIYFSYIFALSKYLELFDTVILILKKPKRKLDFLHWYHHITVLAFTWYAEYLRYSAGFFFIIFNALVHTFMYFYYFLREIDIFVPRPISMSLTFLQIFQMFFGIYINGLWAYYVFVVGLPCLCVAPRIIVTSSCIMYGSYLFLFCKFFYYRYLAPQPTQKEKKETKKQKEKKNK
eukprot:TRINITY_DN13_c0_g3_i1.p1 TRINITY_DN13_c0_g3~~TRINITY_DN13_c0_g3_i1.p1  ORF type:complete len:287 (+),score=43.78 TRINITY_DN13_c0_g3_i1:90-950(+)